MKGKNPGRSRKRTKKILTRKESHQAWVKRNIAQASTVSKAGLSWSQAAKVTPVQHGTPPAQPDVSVRP